MVSKNILIKFYLKFVKESRVAISEIWDINQLTNYNMNNDEFIDGTHGIEVSTVKILLCMLNQKSKLSDFVSKENLTSDLNERKQLFCILAPNFTNYGDTPKVY